uniref:Putative RdRp-complex n=1 Tax=Linepithema humile qinvirus-like virus 1 TaxID=2259782 RepID=A0A2Z4Z3J7_9VIRU|nr:putative RdRp-complex [Linepithema humile qinvirus-like virus 1]
MIFWNSGMELVSLKSMTPDCLEAHDELSDGSCDIDIEKFNVKSTKAAKTLGVQELYSMMGLYIFVYQNQILMLDYSSLDQVHCVSKMWEGFYCYAHNYSLVGMGNSPKEISPIVVDSCASWMVSSLEATDFTDKLASSMKQSLALLQNDMHSEAESLEVHLNVKSQKLKELMKEVLPLPQYWHEFLSSLFITQSVQLDLANMFYALPAPDCNLKLLFERASVYMQNANKANCWDFLEFMNYCMAVDLCKAVTLYKTDVTYETEPNYDIKEQSWYKSCLKGKLILPPDDEMGKAWISNFFPFNNTLPQWYWEAADVTHVLADNAPYEDLHKFSQLSSSSHNELLYAIDCAPQLSYKWDPVEVLSMLGSGQDKWNRMAVMAVKCENTKPGPKCSETWSADDVTSELTTCYDSAAIPMAAMYQGVTASKSDMAVQTMFDRICAMTSKDNPSKVIMMSNDVSGWSPLGDRDSWAQHHDYLISMTKAPSNLKLKDIWKGMGAYVAKSGLMASTSLTKGLFQGWTGTCDSMFNVHISLYCVSKAKSAGWLLSSEAANTAGLMDDAVQAVELDPSSSIEHQQRAADSHFATTAETWKSLGAELDVVKTIYSSSKFMYLNRFFCEGSEVLTPMKIFASADKEFNSSFAPVFSQMDTVLGSYRAAVEKGSCPMTGYYFAMSSCLQLAAYSNYMVTQRDICNMVNAVFAPSGLGGWGMPHFTAWLTQEAQDSLSMYTSVMTSVIEVVNEPVVKESFNSLLMGTLNQEMELVGMQALLSNPLGVQVAGLVHPEQQVSSSLKHGMLKKCKSTVFSDALEAGETPEVLEALSKVVSCASWDAAILELLGQCLPSTCSSALVDSAYKNELVTQLFPFSISAELSSIIRSGSAMSVDFLLSKQFGSFDVEASSSMAYDLALECSSSFYQSNEIEVSNHTIPDYGTCLASQFPGVNPGLVVKSKWPKHSCETDKLYTSNMYDGITVSDKSRTPSSMSAYTFTGESYSYMTPVQSCICKAAVVSAYLTSQNAHGKLFWDIVTAVWGAEGEVTPPMVTTVIKPDTSTKSLSASKSHLTHAMSAFSNVHDCVEVIADPMGAYLNAKSTHVDYMSMVTAASFVGLMNLAISNGDEQLDDLFFGFLEGSMPLTEDDKLTVFMPQELNDYMGQLTSVTNKNLFKQVLDSMVDVQYSSDEGEEYMCIGFSSEHMGTLKTGQEVSIAAGYLSNMISCGMVATAATSKSTSMVSLAGDEVMSSPTLRADTSMSQLSSNVPTSQAVICLAMETVKDLCPGGVRMNMAQAPWQKVPEEFQQTFPNWTDYWSNVSNMMKSYTTVLDQQACKALLGHVPNHILMHLVMLDGRSNSSALLVVSYLYLAAYGSLRCPESYTLTSALGMAHASSCWNLAASVSQETSSKWQVSYSSDSDLMGSVYHSMSMAAQNFYNKLQVLSAIPIGMSNHMLSYYGGSEFDIPEIDGSFLGLPPNDNGYWYDVRDSMLDQLHGVGFNLNYLCSELDNIANDIFALGEIKKLVTIEAPTLYHTPTELQVQLELPVLTEVEIQEEKKIQVDQTVMKAAAAYLEQGMHFALLVYKGEEDYEMDEEPTEEEINEFLAELKEQEHAPDNGQEPDEAQ